MTAGSLHSWRRTILVDASWLYQPMRLARAVRWQTPEFGRRWECRDRNPTIWGLLGGR